MAELTELDLQNADKARWFAEDADERFRTDLLLFLLREVTLDREFPMWKAYRDANGTSVGLLCYVIGENEDDQKIFHLKTMFGAYDAMIKEFCEDSNDLEQPICVSEGDLQDLPDREARLERWGFECQSNQWWVWEPRAAH